MSYKSQNFEMRKLHKKKKSYQVVSLCERVIHTSVLHENKSKEEEEEVNQVLLQL